MKTSDQVTNIFTALAECKKDFVPLQKNKQGYGYKYVTLDVVIDMLNAVLPKYGLGFVQFPSNNGEDYALTTRVFHTSGEWLEDTVSFSLTEISKANDTQKLGASVTYFRRYTLSSIFGISTDEDVDGNVETAQEKSSVKKQFNENNSYKNTYYEKPKHQEQMFTLTDGVYFTSDENVNEKIKSIISEQYKSVPVFSEKTLAWFRKQIENNAFKTTEEYVNKLLLASGSSKSRIDQQESLGNDN